jgi:hypothetical protein
MGIGPDYFRIYMRYGMKQVMMIAPIDGNQCKA